MCHWWYEYVLRIIENLNKSAVTTKTLYHYFLPIWWVEQPFQDDVLQCAVTSVSNVAV